MIPAFPYLAPWYRIATADDQVVLEYGQRIICLAGRAGAVLMPVLLPLLDGTRTLDEIVEVLGRPARPAIEAALQRLDECGVLLEGPPLPDDVPACVSATAGLLASLDPGRTPLGETVAALGSRSVAVVGDGVAAAEVCRLLRRSGVGVWRADALSGEADLVVCAPAPAQLPELAGWNAQALASGQPWLQVLPFDGRYAAVGPLYLPDETCCFECFRLRRAANLDGGDELALLEAAPARYPASPPLVALVAGVAATVALEWLVLRSHYAPSAFYAVQLGRTLELSVHHVYRVPRCPACSDSAAVAAPLPWHKEHAGVGG
ncbi:MAG TPA: TOMM precursor leader peptide-binding protein [Gaiellaceae bacterium]|nr:TOMM precursor leader peptide-binding protein [Gaiellaceae bacterium]